MNTADRLVAALRAAGLATGDGEPRDENGALAGRYCIMRPRTQARGEGSIGEPNADREVELQITSVGPSRKAADQVADDAQAVALGPLEPPDGWSWMQTATYAGSTATSREPETDPNAPEAPMWFRVDIYCYYLTPA